MRHVSKIHTVERSRETYINIFYEGQPTETLTINQKTNTVMEYTTSRDMKTRTHIYPLVLLTLTGMVKYFRRLGL